MNRKMDGDRQEARPHPGPLLGTEHYPYSRLLDTRGAGLARLRITKYIAAKSSNRCKPSHKVCVPGSPSALRPRKPPKLATMRTASRKLGGSLGTWGLWVT